MMFDSEKFIRTVQEHPAIWDMGSKDYLSKEAKMESWNMIGYKMYLNWNEMPHSQREEKVKDLKCKWRHIRDSYMKFLNQNSGGYVLKKRKYIYAEILTFLKQSSRKRKKSSYYLKNVGLDPLSNKESEEIPEEQEHKVFSSEQLCISHSSIQDPSDCVSLPNPENSATTIIMPNSTQNHEMLGITSAQENNIDPDKAFMLSLLPDYKRLTYAQQLDFRLQALQFFKNINLTNQKNL